MFAPDCETIWEQQRFMRTFPRLFSPSPNVFVHSLSLSPFDLLSRLVSEECFIDEKADFVLPSQSPSSCNGSWRCK